MLIRDKELKGLKTFEIIILVSRVDKKLLSLIN